MMFANSVLVSLVNISSEVTATLQSLVHLHSLPPVSSLSKGNKHVQHLAARSLITPERKMVGQPMPGSSNAVRHATESVGKWQIDC